MLSYVGVESWGWISNQSGVQVRMSRSYYFLNIESPLGLGHMLGLRIVLDSGHGQDRVSN